jgi:2-methylcitrate dehydratase PrpD
MSTIGSRAVSRTINEAAMNPETITGRLIALIEAKPIGEADIEQAALFTLDAVANALAGRNSPPGRKLVDWASAEPRDAGRSAFLMGGLTHILEVDDLHKASVVHPGCVVVPAAWSVASREGLKGRALLTAILKGFEATTRVGMAVGPAHYRIWHNTATCGPYGSAYAAASLLGLDRAATLHALGNAGAQSSGLWQFLETGAMTKHFHAGRAAEAGVIAADLARRGFTGPPAILEGAKGFFAAACPDAEPEAVTRDADAPWQLTVTSIKPWPSCRHTHPTIDACLDLHAGLVPDTLAGVCVETYQAALDVCDRPAPDSEYEAKFSLQHCAAAALALGRIDFAAFGPDQRAALAPVREKVTIKAAEPYASNYPEAWGSAVTVLLEDGTERRASKTHAKGDPEAPLDRDEMIAKARSLLAFAGLGGGEVETMIGAVLALAEDGPLPALPLFEQASCSTPN